MNHATFVTRLTLYKMNSRYLDAIDAWLVFLSWLRMVNDSDPNFLPERTKLTVITYSVSQRRPLKVHLRYIFQSRNLLRANFVFKPEVPDFLSTSFSPQHLEPSRRQAAAVKCRRRV